MNKYKHYLIALGVVLVVAAVGAAVKLSRKPQVKEQPGSNNEQVAQMLEFKDLGSAETSKALPADLPIDRDAQVTRNFEAKDPATGRSQATKVYLTGRTLDQVYAAYQTYLQGKGWTVAASLDQAEIKNLTADKGSARLDITISKDASGKTQAAISYLY